VRDKRRDRGGRELEGNTQSEERQSDSNGEERHIFFLTNSSLLRVVISERFAMSSSVTFEQPFRRRVRSSPSFAMALRREMSNFAVSYSLNLCVSVSVSALCLCLSLVSVSRSSFFPPYFKEDRTMVQVRARDRTLFTVERIFSTCSSPISEQPKSISVKLVNTLKCAKEAVSSEHPRRTKVFRLSMEAIRGAETEVIAVRLRRQRDLSRVSLRETEKAQSLSLLVSLFPCLPPHA
jgi:hypothetical protein